MPDGLTAELAHCGRSMARNGGACTWSGDFELTTQVFVCRECGQQVTLSASVHVGPPESARAGAGGG